jgi:hypothetical protein
MGKKSGFSVQPRGSFHHIVDSGGRSLSQHPDAASAQAALQELSAGPPPMQGGGPQVGPASPSPPLGGPGAGPVPQLPPTPAGKLPGS